MDATSTQSSTREKLKEAAQRLFAEHGLDGVSVRDIVSAADQRNSASLHYYFGSKDALISELIVDSVKQLDATRNRALDKLVRRKRPPELAEIVRIIAAPQLPRKKGQQPQTTLRFINMLQQRHRSLLRDVLQTQGNLGYRRGAEMIAALLPDVDPRLLRERLFFLAYYINAVFSAREAALEKGKGRDSIWRSPTMISNLIDTMVGLLQQNPSQETLSALPPVAKSRQSD